MLRVVLFGCGVCAAYLAGRAGIGKLKEHAVKAGAGSEGSPMSIIAKGVLIMQDHIGPWSAADVILGFAAMAKITEKDPLPVPGHEVPELARDSEFLARAQHWRAMAEAVYVSDPASFSLFSHLPESSIVSAEWQIDQNSLRPAYALFLDYSFGAALVLSVRGTSHVVDVLVNAGGLPVPFEGGHAHEGFTRSTHALLSEVGPHIQRVFREDGTISKKKKLVIAGHSMGAAIGIMCGLKLRKEYGDVVECWGYSVPAAVTLELAKKCSSFSTSFVALHDVVPRFSVASIEELRKRVCDFDWKRAEEIVGREDEDWQKISKAVETMQKFQSNIGSSVQEFQSQVCSAVGGGKSCDKQKCEDEDSQRPREVPMLHPPGRMLVLCSDPAGCGKAPGQRKGVAEQRNYGAFPTYEEAKGVNWVMHEAQQEDFSQIILSPWSVSDHMLGNLCEGIHFFQKTVSS